MVLWVSMFYAAVPNGTCKQGWGLSSWGRLKPINLTLASVTRIDGLMMRTGVPVPDPAATLLVLYGSYAHRYISEGTFLVRKS